MLTVVGLQIPIIPFKDVIGNIGAVSPTQRAAIVLNVGVTKGFTVIVIGITLAHCPVFGVNV